MIKGTLEKAINSQINAELYSSYLYVSMSSYFSSVNLKGFAHWMRVQVQEELVHAVKFYDYLVGRGGRVVLTAVKAPPSEWDSPLKVFENVLSHEQKVTGLINDLVNLSMSEGDHATTAFLQWFVTEQVEEEASADEIVKKLNLIKDQAGALLMVDQELGQRVFTPPAQGQT